MFIEKDYYSIGEISKIVGIKAYILRYWEHEKLLIPLRRTSGQRYYSKNDINKILTIKKLLYDQKFSIKGAKKELIEIQKIRQQNNKNTVNIESKKFLQEIQKDIKDILKMLK
ncbi:MerR family transcriptional regulator [bacterium]